MGAYEPGPRLCTKKIHICATCAKLNSRQYAMNASYGTEEPSHVTGEPSSAMGESSQVPLVGCGFPGRLRRRGKQFAMPHLAPNEARRNHQSLAARHIETHRRRIVRILFVDDRQSDVDRCLQELKRMDFAVSADWVQVPAEFAERLRTRSYDVIVCDYSMGSWTGMEALELLRQSNLEIPFILVTSILDENMTDAFIRKGAFDCVDKNRLNRLPLAVALAVD